MVRLLRLYSIVANKRQNKWVYPTPKQKQIFLRECDFYTEQVESIPTDIYNELSRQSGRCKKTEEATSIGLNNSLCSIVVKEKESNRVVGMVRLVGDGGTFCAIVGLCVLNIFHNNSDYENGNNNDDDNNNFNKDSNSNNNKTNNDDNTNKKKFILERMLLKKLDEFIDANIPKSCYVTIIASKRSRALYETFGFVRQKMVNRFGMFLKK